VPAKINIAKQVGDLIIDLCSKGETLVKISEKIGIERHVIKNYLILNNVTFNGFYSNLFQNRIIGLYKEFKSTKAVAEKLGIANFRELYT